MTRTPTRGAGTDGDATRVAYQTCAAVTRSEARNFAYGIALLPPVKRRAMTAVYAMARRIDDVGDGDLPADRKRALLGDLRRRLHDIATSGTADGDAVGAALADAAGRLPIPLAAFDELLDGCGADVDGRQYRTFDDLHWYCRCVAGSVGRLSVGVYAPTDLDAALAPADALGVALQLTNILRDLREDRRTGRVYLPAEDLERFGCSLDLDAEGNLSDPVGPFAALVRFEAARAEEWYERGRVLLPMLDHRSAACTAAMAGIYHRLLRRIAARPDVVRSARTSLPATGKALVAARALATGRW